ncbi:unnamed protein product [Mytilus edulis]|uniref:Exonuclease domain-containing protein n=1 Tax=Mytilus edulis TaxID=6550 RepID=A0A8S3UDS9_MYTED|nr:unnamed protein product [Mytilus edulis]
MQNFASQLNKNLKEASKFINKSFKLWEENVKQLTSMVGEQTEAFNKMANQLKGLNQWLRDNNGKKLQIKTIEMVEKIGIIGTIIETAENTDIQSLMVDHHLFQFYKRMKAIHGCQRATYSKTSEANGQKDETETEFTKKPLISKEEGFNFEKVNDVTSDIQQIPSRLTINDSEELIIFDLETTGLSRNSDITQIAASSGSNIFQRYIMPRCEITHEASKITGLTFSHSTNKMYLKGTIVQTCAIEQALLDFIDFLKLQNKPVLVGHNITNFDMMVLENRLREFSLFATFSAHVKGFIDTLKLSKRVFPKDKKLRENCTDDDLHHVNFNHSGLSLKPLVDKKVVNTLISFKLARSGITLSHLKIAKTGDINGIKVILTENRVNSKYVGSIIQHLSESEE